MRRRAGDDSPLAWPGDSVRLGVRLGRPVAVEPGIVRKAEAHYVQVELAEQHTHGQTPVDWYDRIGHEPNVNLVGGGRPTTVGTDAGSGHVRVAQMPASEAILGYRLRKAVWGRGYATPGVWALIRKGFVKLGVQRVVAATYEENLASRLVMEELGMNFPRRFRVTAEEIAHAHTYDATSLEPWDGDDVEYVLERADWEQEERAGGR